MGYHGPENSSAQCRGGGTQPPLSGCVCAARHRASSWPEGPLPKTSWALRAFRERVLLSQSEPRPAVGQRARPAAAFAQGQPVGGVGGVSPRGRGGFGAQRCCGSGWRRCEAMAPEGLSLRVRSVIHEPRRISVARCNIPLGALRLRQTERFALRR